MVRTLSVFLILLFLILHLFGGTTGKITGKTVDKHNGSPLPGVNIEVGETGIGAASDVDGYYVILNVPVGSHELKVSYIGYKAIKIMNIKVSADVTTHVDCQLEIEILEVSEAIEVVAERELIQVDNTASLTVIPAEMVDSQPVDNVTQAVGLTAGVTEGSFRGGRVGTGEVKYLLDGVDLSSPIGTVTRGFNPGQVDGTGFNPQRETENTVGLATDILESSIEEVQVITGGMGPQYDAKSAVVNIVTKSNPRTYSGFARIRMTPSMYGNGSIIPHSYGQVSGFMSDEEAIAEAKQFGTGSKYNNEHQYASPSKAFVNPKYRRYEFGIGGPIPIEVIAGQGRMSFNISLDIFDQGGFYRGQNLYQETLFIKWTYQTAASQTFSLNFLTSRRNQLRWRHWDSRIVTTGDTVYDYRAGEETPNKFLIGSAVHPDGRLEAVKDFDMLNGAINPESNSHLLAFSYKKMISSKTFYEINISRFRSSQKIRVNDPATGRPMGIEDFAEFRFQQPTNPSFFPEGGTLGIGCV